MTSIAEFSIPLEEFALRETLERRPDLVFEVERVVAHDTTHVMPFIWVSGGKLEGLTQILEADSSVTDIELLSESNNERLYQLSWADKARVIGQMVIEYGATIQQATAADGQWTIRALFPDRSSISKVIEFAQGNNLSLELNRLYGIDSAERARFNLSEEQQEALVEGYEHGYYNVPRDIDAISLGDKLDISHQALSERIRRATGNLIENTLVVDEGDSV